MIQVNPAKLLYSLSDFLYIKALEYLQIFTFFFFGGGGGVQKNTPKLL